MSITFMLCLSCFFSNNHAILGHPIRISILLMFSKQIWLNLFRPVEHYIASPVVVCVKISIHCLLLETWKHFDLYLFFLSMLCRIMLEIYGVYMVYCVSIHVAVQQVESSYCFLCVCVFYLFIYFIFFFAVHLSGGPSLTCRADVNITPFLCVSCDNLLENRK